MDKLSGSPKMEKQKSIFSGSPKMELGSPFLELGSPFLELGSPNLANLKKAALTPFKAAIDKAFRMVYIIFRFAKFGRHKY